MAYWVTEFVFSSLSLDQLRKVDWGRKRWMTSLLKGYEGLQFVTKVNFKVFLTHISFEWIKVTVGDDGW